MRADRRNDDRDDRRDDDGDAGLHQRLDDFLSGNAPPPSGHDPRDAKLWPLVVTANLLQRQEYPQYRPGFADDLEARLYAEMDSAAASHTTNTTGSRETLPPLLARRLRIVASHRRLVGWVAAAALLLVVLSAATVAVAQAAPDSPFYGVAQAIQKLEAEVQRRLPVFVSAVDPVAQAQQQVTGAENALTGLESAIAQGNHTSYGSALQRLQDAYGSADKAVTRLPAGGERDNLASRLKKVRDQAVNDLSYAVPGMIWDDRVLTTQTLHVLGAPTPDIRGFSYARGKGVSPRDSASSSLTITIHGSGFLAGAVVYLNGKPFGTVTKVASREIQVVVRGGTSFSTSDFLGVGNPDGTAVQKLVIQQGNRSPQATPQPSVEATPATP